MKKTRRYCPDCGKYVYAEAQTTSAMLHVIACILTCGAWLPIWALVALCTDGRYYCPNDGSLTRKYPESWFQHNKGIFISTAWVIALFVVLAIGFKVYIWMAVKGWVA